MSLWFSVNDKRGKRHLYSVNIPVLPVITFWGILLALLMPLVAALRAWLTGP